MLTRIRMHGIELPRLYIAENNDDVKLAMSKGIPFVKWKDGEEKLIKLLLRPTLERLFPHIRWNELLGPRDYVTTIYNVEGGTSDGTGTMSGEDDGGSDIAKSKRTIGGSISEGSYVMQSIETYMKDCNSSVNVDVLQELRLMPQFIGDIIDCIRVNIGSGMYWREGYNKRRGIPIGRYDTSGQLPNLIILDVSRSIPRGISATMLTLIDTLRTQTNADLIVTGSTSLFYPNGSELPTPQELRATVLPRNESAKFNEVLVKHVAGRKFGHVFSFGDNDSPYLEVSTQDCLLQGTTVGHVHHYHTWAHGLTGYAEWCTKLCNAEKVSYNTSWCHIINRD